MPKLPVITSRKLVKILQKCGFFIHHQSGSHINFRHTSKIHLHVVVPFHSRNLAPKTLKSILVQSEISVQELIDLF
jgi:predicted RNA binding protein YcfA (HicA-like mRNA interferase family)